LFVADRLDHLVNKIDGLLDKMKEGYTVITDRYYFSSYAYHSVHLPMEWVVQANALSAGLLRPDLNVFIDIAPEVAMQRINKGRHGAELYETLENLAAVRQKYFEAFDLLKNEEKVSVIKGEGTPDETAENIWQALGNL
ncbi:MAG TPA: hypothetical protein VG603_07825, partial [Chitinophagales bacterium]|nr:hypothetical protein [Chitinophagales bacterium]